MKIIEYGKENSEVILLLHGGGLSWWNYRAEAELLKDTYHVVLPILDGHAGSDTTFLSIEKNAAELIAYIDANFHGPVLAIGGLSLGAQILTEMLSQRKDICHYAIIESALTVPMKMTADMIGPMLSFSYGLIKQKWFAKLQFRSLKIQPALFEEYYRDTCRIHKEDMIRFLQANSSYTAKPSLTNTSAKTMILVGSKEQGKMKRSAEILHDMIPGSTYKVLAGYSHGELSLNHPQEYTELLKRFLAGDEIH
jgi:pimeloyl-ACP methyl ester carboxylesterase